LRWTGHAVAYPSKHLSGNIYKFNNAYFPRKKPLTITMDNIRKVIKRYCFNVDEYFRQHENYSHYQYFLDKEYAFHCVYPSGGGITAFGIYKMPFYLFLDLETNGLPSTYKDPESDWQNWPEIVQIAYLICDADGKRIKEESLFIKPDNWMLSDEASDFLNLTNDDLRRKGQMLETALDYLFHSEDFFYSSNEPLPFKYIIGHNIEYDINCLKAALTKINKNGKYNPTAYEVSKLIQKVPTLCTMKSTTEFCALGGYKGNKYPKLEELYEKLFDKTIVGQHDALNDVRATSACFWNLKDLGIIDKPN